MPRNLWTPRRLVRVGKPGFTLIEVMIVVALLGIVAAMAVPSFRRVMEQARVDNAAAGLRSIWAAQRVYRLDNSTFAADLPTLAAGGLLESSLVSSTGSFVFQVTSVSTQTFTASATRVGSVVWTGALTIDQDGQISGSISQDGVPTIQPGLILGGTVP
jgi:type IV pilus assembly protein PilE